MDMNRTLHTVYTSCVYRRFASGTAGRAIGPPRARPAFQDEAVRPTGVRERNPAGDRRRDPGAVAPAAAAAPCRPAAGPPP